MRMLLSLMVPACETIKVTGYPLQESDYPRCDAGRYTTTFCLGTLSPAVTAPPVIRAVSLADNSDGTFIVTAVQHAPEKAIVDKGRYLNQSRIHLLVVLFPRLKILLWK